MAAPIQPQADNGELLFPSPEVVPLADGAAMLCGFACDVADGLVDAVGRIAAVAPFRHLITPGGYRMSVAMTNCGAAGWVSDRRGYRYTTTDPESGRPWPAMPPLITDLAARAAVAAGFTDYAADVCLINRYQPGSRLSLHQDRDERDKVMPIVSVSLGLPATFLFGGLKRSDRPRRIGLRHGDVVVWGGPARMTYHGIAPLADGEHPATGRCRLNLTLRRAL